MNRPTLSPRQDYVIAQLYERFGWAAETIAKCLTLGRRTVENALRRQHVTIQRRSKKAFEHLPHLTDEAAKQWFHKAASSDEAELEPAVMPVGETVVYRRRRCQDCGRVSAYETHCPSCRKELDWKRPTIHDAAVTALASEEAMRHEQS